MKKTKFRGGEKDMNLHGKILNVIRKSNIWYLSESHKIYTGEEFAREFADRLTDPDIFTQVSKIQRQFDNYAIELNDRQNQTEEETR